MTEKIIDVAKDKGTVTVDGAVVEHCVRCCAGEHGWAEYTRTRLGAPYKGPDGTPATARLTGKVVYTPGAAHAHKGGTEKAKG